MDSPKELQPAGKASRAMHRFLRKSKKESDAHVGKTAMEQTFYENPYSDDSEHIDWVEWMPPSLPVPKKIKFEGAAVQIYKMILTKTELQQNVSVSERFRPITIRLQSPYLRDVLEEDLKKHYLKYDAQGFANSQYPHSALFFCRDKITRLAETSEDELTRSHCEVLCKVIGDNLELTLDAYERYETNSKISFDSLWTLFPTGSIFATETAGVESAFRVTSASYYDSSFRLKCEVVDFDGCGYGKRAEILDFPSFTGEIDASELKPFPVFDLTRHSEMRDRLVRRGREILRYQSPQFVAQRQGEKEGEKGTRTEERIVIDAYSAVDPPLAFERIDGYSRFTADGMRISSEDEKSQDERTIVESSKPDNPPRARPTEKEIERNNKVMEDDEENLLLLSPHLHGYHIADNRWDLYNVEDLCPVNFHEDAFKKISYNEEKKSTLFLLVQAYLDSKVGHYDLITGKGHCLLVLLSGQTGTGKTLMAEAVADKLQKPLLRISSVKFDSSWSETSDEFSSKIKKASEWGALVLFDEANFIDTSQGRSKGGALSVFLERIEYFKGIVFLTTNITTKFDAALLSRVQIHLTFHELTPSMRAQVWRGIMEGGPGDIEPFTDAEVSSLAEWKINGREIRNAFNMAVSWCHQTGNPLTARATENLIRIINPFASKGDESGDKAENVQNDGSGGKSSKDMLSLLDM